MALLDLTIASEPYCYITTTGRSSGKPHTIEIWFGVDGDTVYILAGSGARSDTVRNVRREPRVRIRIGATTFAGRARLVEPETAEDALARRLLLEKYTAGYSGSLDNWGRTALPLAIEVSGITSTDPADALWPKGRRLG